MPQYIESNAGLLQSFIAAQNASAVNKTQSIKNIAETVAAAVNAHYKSKEDKIKEQLARIEHEKQAEIALGESKMKQATQAADILTKLRPVEPSGYANLPRINFQGSGGPLNLPGSVAPSYGYPAYPELAETTPPELKSILGPKYSRIEKTTDVTVTPDQYTQVLNAYKDKPDILKKLSTTTQPGMRYTDFIKSVQTATKESTSDFGGNGGAGTLTEDTKNLLAEKFLATGQMEALGMGASGMRGEILNRAAKMAKAQGKDGQALTLQKASYEADKGALVKLTNIKDQTLSFEKQARKNIELADKMAQKLDSAGNTVFNKWWVNRVRGQYAGDKDVENFQLALTAATKEYAKVISGGAGSVQALSDTANKEIQDLINKGQSYEAFRQKMDIMLQEMRNRESSYNEQLKEITDRINPEKKDNATPSISTKTNQSTTGKRVISF